MNLPLHSPWPRAAAAAVARAARAARRAGRRAAAAPAAGLDCPAPAAEAPTPAAAGTADTLAAWEALPAALDAVLARLGPDTDWLADVLALRERVRLLMARDTDLALLQLIHSAGQDSSHYSSRHALLCLVVARETARHLHWPATLLASLDLAALTMNAAMAPLQDALARADAPPSAAQRQAIAHHADAAALALQHAGVADAVWVDIVRAHHDDRRDALALGQLPGAERAARLLRRVDRFTAMLSCRQGRPPLSPVAAARAACVDAGGTPDEIGCALLQAVGLYPPGSFVQLAGGELALVVARGPRANLPRVALLTDDSGRPLPQPRLRDTHDRRHAVRGALPADQASVRPALPAVLAALSGPTAADTPR